MFNRRILHAGLLLISSFGSFSTANAREVAECGVIYRKDWKKVWESAVTGCGGSSCVGLDSCKPVTFISGFEKAIHEVIFPGNPLYDSYNGPDKGPDLCLLVGIFYLDRFPEFGIESYRDCSIKKTTGELTEYIAQNKLSIANDGKDLLQFQSNFYSEEKNQIAMGCLIANYQADAIYSGLATELKTQFQNAFSTVFDSAAFTANVCSQAQASSIQSATCADSDTSTKCGNLRRYRDNLALLQTKKAEILDLKNDVVPRQNAAYAAELDGLISLMPQEARN